MAWMHGLERDPGEWAALRRCHESQNAALDGFLQLMRGLERCFQAISADLGILGALTREARNGLPPRRGV